MNIDRYHNQIQRFCVENQNRQSEKRLSGSTTSSSFICKTERILEKARSHRPRSKPSQSLNKDSTRSKEFVSHLIHDLPITAAVVIPTAIEDERSNVTHKNSALARYIQDRSATMVPPLRENSEYKEYSKDCRRKSWDTKSLAASDALPDARPEKTNYLNKKIRESSMMQRDASSAEICHLLNELKDCNQQLTKSVAQMNAEEGYNSEITNSVADFLKTCDKVLDQKGIKRNITPRMIRHYAGETFPILDSNLTKGICTCRRDTYPSFRRQKKVTFHLDVETP